MPGSSSLMPYAPQGVKGLDDDDDDDMQQCIFVYCFKYTATDIDIFVNCTWVDTQWQ